MAHGERVEFNWEDGTPKWDNDRKKVWLKWKWYNPYHTPHLTEVLDHFEIQIRYTFKNANGGIETQQKSPESMSDFRDGDFIFDYYWEVPADCLTVEFAIHAIAKTKSENGGSVPMFEDDPWPAPPFYCGDATVPDKPSAPSVSHNAQIGTQVVLGLDNVRDGDNNQNVVQVEFQTVTYDADPDVSEGTIIQNTAKAKVDEFGNARALVYIGNKYGYKFRARLCGVRDKDAGGTIERQIEVYSEWSELSDLVLGVPERPSITVRKYTDASAEYKIKAKNPYDHYQIQSAQTLESFEAFDNWESEYPQFKENSEERTAALQNCGVNERSVESQNGWISNLTTLEAGKAYWRVRSVTAQSDGFYSTWSEPFELTFGEPLRAPIVSMGSQFANLDDNSIRLIIRHNSPNGSPTCRCDIHLRVGSGGEVLPWFDTIRPEDMTVGRNNDGSYTYYYDLNLKDSRINLQQEDTITWYAYTFEGNRAAESMETRSPHSEHVTFWVYEKPSVELAILSQNGESIPLDDNNRYVVPGFPIRLVTSSNLGEKKVVSWNVRIISLANYYNTGRHGEVEVINAGEVLYNIVDVKTPDDLDRLISASDVTLDQAIPYRLEVIAAINTGVTVTAVAEFTIILPEAYHLIECAANYNFDNISLGLCPSAYIVEEPEPEPVIKDTWEEKTWGGLTSFNGSSIWTDGDNIYYSLGTYQYVLDKSTDNWVTKSWNVSSFDGSDIWTDGDNIYYSHKFSTSTTPPVHTYVHYILNKTTGDWEEKIWNGDALLDSGYYIWTDGTNTYYSHNYDHYVLDKATSTWSEKTWSGREYFNGNYIWTDGTDVYYSNSSTQYVLDKATSTWSEKTWNGLSSLWGHYIWTDGTDIYYSYDYDSAQYVLDKATSTWNEKTWKGENDITGSNIWTDGTDIYYSGTSRQYILTASEPEPEVEHWEEITMIGRENIYPGYMWTDGENAYYSYGSTTYVLNTDTYTWEYKTWNGAESIYFQPNNIWTDGEKVYYSDGYSTYVLDKETSTWSSKTWTGISSLYGKNVWTDGTNTYYSYYGYSSDQYVLNKTTGQWESKTWNGTAPYGGEYVWTDGENVYHTYGYDSYILDKETSTWTRVTFTGEYSYPEPENIWTDGRNAYYSYYSNQYVLNKETLEWEAKTWDGIDSLMGYYIYTDGTNMYYSGQYESKDYVLIVPQPEPEPEPTKTLDPNVELAIYRKNEDGTFVTIAENIQNTDKVFVTDPHPNLGGSEYRIVATDTISGKMEFYDPPPYDMKCTDIILQWDETYPDIPFNDDDRDTIRAFGSFLRLPYNIDVSDSANIENSMVNYIGRKNPVSYYGTQTGYTSSWSTEIPKYDKDTIRKLRRLQVWPGDVYVREPNGTGYWAHVTVSFPINHLALTVSVSLSITRVEGGM